MTKNAHRRNTYPYFILGSFCLFIFKDIIFHGHLLYGSDFIAFYQFFKQFLYDELHRHHSIPFWNPYILGGIPFWAHFESSIFYPLDLLFWILPAEKAYGPTMFIHFVLSAFFMYKLTRSFSIGRTGCFVAATIFTANGLLMANLYTGQMCRVKAYPWIPLIIFFLNQAIKSKNRHLNAALAGFFWGIQILAGAPQDAFYTFLAALLFLACHLKFRPGHIRANRNIGTVCGLLLVMGIGLASIQLLPAFEFIENSVRSAFDRYGLVTMGSYPPQGVITMFMPHFFGDYTKGTFWVNDVPWSIPEQNLYVGILSIFMPLFLSIRHSGDRRILIFAGFLALTALLLAFGKNTFLYKIVYYLPGFNMFRAPSKIIVLWVFAMSILAGKGTDDLCRQDRTTLVPRLWFFILLIMLLGTLDVLFRFKESMVLKVFGPFLLHGAIPEKFLDSQRIMTGEFHRSFLIFLCMVLLILFFSRGILKGKALSFSMGALLIIDLSLANRGAVMHDDRHYAWIREIQRDFDTSLGRDKSLFRVGSHPFFPVGPNFEMYLGYQTVGGYTALYPHRYHEYINQAKCYEGPPRQGWALFSYAPCENPKLMDLLNVKYEISHNEKRVEIRQTFLPRAFIVNRYELMPTESILDYMVRPGFDPLQTILLEDEHFKPRFDLVPPDAHAPPGEVRILRYTPDHITLEASTKRPGLLFLSEMFYPGWKAFVDGNPVEILRGNYLFRVLEVPAGRHEIQMVFDPPSIKIGIGISIFTLFVFLELLIFHVLKNRSAFSRKVSEGQ